MDSMTRQFGLLCLGALAAMITACASNNVSQCEATGILCPSGMHCAAAEPICIADTNLCGDAHVDPGEECDDGNTKDGDGCSHECKVEMCGNGHIDFGEVCDNGPGKNGQCMGCAADCKSFETCGDGVLDTACGEVCDDHNTKSGDGCAADCKSTEICGNGIIDTAVGEVCDDGDKNGTAGDQCSENCRSNRMCGNGTVDKDLGEECDAGTAGAGNPNGNSDTNDCRLDCQFNRCGDGFVDMQDGPRHEECDGGSLTKDSHNQLVATPAEQPDCNIDCTTPSCGDGKVNHHFIPKDAAGVAAAGPEQCDNGAANNDNAACTSTCQINVCGDGHTLTGVEACDDGGVDTANCNANCTKPSCGDGLVNTAAGEQCDNGRDNNGKNLNQDTAACTSACKINVCGDGNVLAGIEQCDSHGMDSTTCDFDCTLSVCGDGHTNMAAGEACDDGAANGTASSANHCNQFCQFNGCGDGLVEPGEQCDAGSGGVKKDSAACNSNCTFARCGDGVLNKAAGEDCDDGAANGTAASPSHCNQFCHVNSCGNGILEPGEQCDDGTDSMGNNNNHAGARCNASCQINVCGDHDILQGVEACDDGGVDTANCDSDCTKPVCGDKHTNMAAGETCDDGAANGTAASNCDSFCKSNLCGNGIVDVGAGEECDAGSNGNRAESAQCNSDCTFARCGDGKINHAAGETCDNIDPVTKASLNGVPCDYGDPLCTRCNATCTGNISPGGPFCGDGLTQTNEGCDPTTGPATTLPSLLARADSATCDIDCTPVACGDGHVNAVAGEKCDDGNTSTCGTCATVNCSTTPVPATPATSTITTITGDLIGDGDTLTLDDGFGKTITLEFDLGGLQNANNVPISFAQAPATDAATIASEMVDAVNKHAPVGFLITASVATGGTTVTLTNSRKSVFGNTAIGVTGKIGITGGFTFSASPPMMTGGAAGDCVAGTGCVSGDDCKSGSCIANKCQ